jgi:hypothetical protein
MEYGKTYAEKIGRTVKIKKTHKTNRKKQYREILKQIQGNQQNKIQRKIKTKNKQRKQNIGKQKKKHKIKSRMINRRRLRHDLAGTPLRKVAMGE